MTNFFELIKQAGKRKFEVFVNEKSTTMQDASDYDFMYKNGMVFKNFGTIDETIDFVLNSKKNSYKLNQYQRIGLGRVSSDKFNSKKKFNDFLQDETPNQKKVRENVFSITNKIKDMVNIGGQFKKDRIVITSDENGIFEFGLASSGLYRPLEYYSQELANDINNGKQKNVYEYLKLPIGVVNTKEVVSKKIGNSLFFTVTVNNKTYSCERRQKNTTLLYNKFPDLCFLKPNNQGLVLPYLLKNKNKVFNGKNGYKLKYASRNPKSYLVFDKKEESAKYVDIFAPVNFLGSTTYSSLLNIIAPFLVANTLEAYGVNVRIIALRIGSDRGTHITASITLKKYLENTRDVFNKVANTLGRYSMSTQLFAFLKIFSENEGVQAPKTTDTNSAFSTVYYTEEDYMTNMMQRYKNWMQTNKNESFYDTKVTNPNFQFATTLRATGRIINVDSAIVRNLHRIMFDFYYYIDFLSLEINTFDTVVKIIYDRFLNSDSFKSLFILPDEKTERISILRKYITAMLIEKYQPVSGGEYSDSDKQIKEKRQKFEKKITSMNDAINRL